MDLRALSGWPPGDWVLDVPVKGDQRYGAVTAEWPQRRQAAGASPAPFSGARNLPGDRPLISP
jgi:hypothetical protein